MRQSAQPRASDHQLHKKTQENTLHHGASCCIYIETLQWIRSCSCYPNIWTYAESLTMKHVVASCWHLSPPSPVLWSCPLDPRWTPWDRLTEIQTNCCPEWSTWQLQGDQAAFKVLLTNDHAQTHSPRPVSCLDAAPSTVRSPVQVQLLEGRGTRLQSDGQHMRWGPHVRDPSLITPFSLKGHCQGIVLIIAWLSSLQSTQRQGWVHQLIAWLPECSKIPTACFLSSLRIDTF